jgi:hypothetical protein
MIIKVIWSKVNVITIMGQSAIQAALPQRSGAMTNKAMEQKRWTSNQDVI